MEINKRDRTITISQNTGITVSVALAAMFAGAIFTVATWAADIRNRVTATELTSTDNTTEIIKLQGQYNESQIKLTEIQTQLKSIDTTLLEIKERVR